MNYILIAKIWSKTLSIFSDPTRIPLPPSTTVPPLMHHMIIKCIYTQTQMRISIHSKPSVRGCKKKNLLHMEFLQAIHDAPHTHRLHCNWLCLSAIWLALRFFFCLFFCFILFYRVFHCGHFFESERYITAWHPNKERTRRVTSAKSMLQLDSIHCKWITTTWCLIRWCDMTIWVHFRCQVFQMSQKPRRFTVTTSCHSFQLHKNPNLHICWSRSRRRTQAGGAVAICSLYADYTL